MLTKNNSRKRKTISCLGCCVSRKAFRKKKFSGATFKKHNEVVKKYQNNDWNLKIYIFKRIRNDTSLYIAPQSVKYPPDRRWATRFFLMCHMTDQKADVLVKYKVPWDCLITERWVGSTWRAACLLSFKNLINITNENFVPVQIVKFSGQGLVNRAVVGKIKPINMSTTIPSRSQKSVSVTRDDVAVNMFVVQFSHSSLLNFCSTTFKSTSSSLMMA